MDIEFVANRLLGALGYGKMYDAKNPFDWMELISFQKASVMNSLNGKLGMVGFMCSSLMRISNPLFCSNPVLFFFPLLSNLGCFFLV